MRKLNLLTAFALILMLSFTLTSCDDDEKDITEDHNEYEVIEHAALHMADAGTDLNATADMPGPHLDEEDYEHTKLNVILPGVEGEYRVGYIHFGPDITGDMYLMLSEAVEINITNRTADGDSPIDLERIFTAQEITDNAGTELIKRAVIFEAKTGGNIIQIGPTKSSVVSIIIEEGGHDH
jgi:hypothetical protein